MLKDSYRNSIDKAWNGSTHCYTLNLLDLLNSVNSFVSHLNHAKISIFHALSLVKNSPSSAEENPENNLSKELKNKLQKSIKIEERPGCEKERVVLQALDISKKIGFLVLDLVLSGLCSDAKPYMEIRRLAGGFDDSLIKDLDCRIWILQRNPGENGRGERGKQCDRAPFGGYIYRKIYRRCGRIEDEITGAGKFNPGRGEESK
ncbi:hypothetical protein DH2020_018593 [Rehmannia glutinosa]|uniref:Uncharacterized protein n=1 Tax=Rehmannia glutinosa TaxID=99300 RepID=A0ABR0WJC2_REHGL